MSVGLPLAQVDLLHFRQKHEGDMPQRLAAVRTVISWLRLRRTTSSKHGGGSIIGRPNFTPRAWAAAIPSRWRVRMCSRSVSATNESICNTRSAMNTASSPRAVVVSRSGMSRTRTWISVKTGQQPYFRAFCFFVLPPLHNVILFVKLLPSTRQVLPKRRGAPAFGLGLLHFVDVR